MVRTCNRPLKKCFFPNSFVCVFSTLKSFSWCRWRYSISNLISPTFVDQVTELVHSTGMFVSSTFWISVWVLSKPIFSNLYVTICLVAWLVVWVILRYDLIFYIIKINSYNNKVLYSSTENLVAFTVQANFLKPKSYIAEYN